LRYQAKTDTISEKLSKEKNKGKLHERVLNYRPF